MRLNKPDNWKEEEDITYVSTNRFRNLISKDGYCFVHETYPYHNRFIRVREDDSRPLWVRMRYRTHNIDVDEEERTIHYEGNDSMWHEVLGTDDDFDELYNILKSKLQE